MTRLGPLLAATAALVVALTACGPDDDPGPNFSSVTPTASASTSASPTASPSEIDTANVPSGVTSPIAPPAADQNSSDGAFAFVTYYWRQVDWAYSTVNGDVLNGLYLSTCASCESSRSQINGVRAKDHSLRGGHITINSQSLAPTDADPSASFAIDTSLTIEPLTEVDSTGGQVAAYPASSYTIRAFVAWSGYHFQVTATSNVGG